VRICDHNIITWADIKEWFAEGGHYKELNCRHPDHKYGFDTPPCPAQLETPFRVRLTYHCRAKTCSKLHLDPTPEPLLLISWRTHMRIPGLGLSGAVDGTDVLRRLDWLRDHGAANIFPRRQGQHPTELRFFDPRLCTCLHFDDSNRPAGWTAPDGCTKCHFHGQARPLPVKGTTVTLSECREVMSKTGSFIQHSSGKWKATSCQDSVECIDMRYERSVALGRCQTCCSESKKGVRDVAPSLPGWVMMLDPESYLFREDRDSIGTYWCDERKCRNYHGRHGENPSKRALMDWGAREAVTKSESWAVFSSLFGGGCFRNRKAEVSGVYLLLGLAEHASSSGNLELISEKTLLDWNLKFGRNSRRLWPKERLLP